jgi:hypothetical protein
VIRLQLSRCAVPAQAGLVVLVLALCLAAPRAGGAVLLVPVATHAVAIDPGMTVLRAGTIPGSVLVRLRGPLPLAGLLRRGVLPLGAPDWLCGR